MADRRTAAGRDSVPRWLAAGAILHSGAFLVFLGLGALNLEGCDRADSLGAAFGVAILLDALLIGGFAVIMHVTRGPGGRRAGYLGLLASIVVALILFVPAQAYVAAIPSGCP